MESLRQRKFSRLIQKELSYIFQTQGFNLFGNSFISITIVRVSQDLSFAKIYLSFLEKNQDRELILELINNQKIRIRAMLARKLKNALRKTPELRFFIDDSFDYYKKIDSLLKE